MHAVIFNNVNYSGVLGIIPFATLDLHKTIIPEYDSVEPKQKWINMHEEQNAAIKVTI